MMYEDDDDGGDDDGTPRHNEINFKDIDIDILNAYSSIII